VVADFGFGGFMRKGGKRQLGRGEGEEKNVGVFLIGERMFLFFVPE